MDKVKTFRQIIKANRRALHDSGLFAKVTVDSWIYTNRVPSYENAKRVADLIGLPLAAIPYYRSERVI